MAYQNLIDKVTPPFVLFLFDLAGLILMIGAIYVANSRLIEAQNQSRKALEISQSNFLFQLDYIFDRHNEAHVNLRPGGLWSTPETGPETTEEWVQIERYMEVFERISVLIEKDILDVDTFRRLYGYRMSNIINNKVIYRGAQESVNVIE